MNPTATDPVRREDLEKARRDFRRMLRRKHISAGWIEEHAEELLAQARVEYAAKLAEGKPADSVVGWLVNGAWWRAQDLLESQGRRPPTSSLDAVFHFADESEPGPEQRALDDDRAETLRRALVKLPEKERRLLALVYFNGDSIRAAGRKVGWKKSAADEHHGQALKRLRAQLGDDRSLLSGATFGPAAWVTLESEGSAALSRTAHLLLTPLHRALAEVAEVGSGTAHRLAALWRRASPLADPAGAAATSGGGRALGACGVAAATILCGVAASGVLPPANSHDPSLDPNTRKGRVRIPSPVPARTPRPLQMPVAKSTSPLDAMRPSRPQLGIARSAWEREKTMKEPPARRAPGKAATSEFGIEASPAPTEASGSAERSPPPEASTRPSTSSAAQSDPPVRSTSSRRSPGGAEFGL